MFFSERSCKALVKVSMGGGRIRVESVLLFVVWFLEVGGIFGNLVISGIFGLEIFESGGLL